MATSITTTNLFSPFETWREILKGITTLISSNSIFSKEDTYYEFEPRGANREFEGYPFFLIESDVSDEPVAMKNLQQMNYSTDLTLRSIMAAKDNIKTYMRLVITYLNSNKTTLLSSYNINIKSLDYDSDIEEYNGKKIAVGKVTVNYDVLLDVES